ncbi:MAG: ribbon-helix-helix domain-containing protein [Pseudomonadota bacterium]
MTAARGTMLLKRSVVLHGHATSVALERAFWDALDEWAQEDGLSVPAMIAGIDARRSAGSLASAIRVALLNRARDSR